MNHTIIATVLLFIPFLDLFAQPDLITFDKLSRTQSTLSKVMDGEIFAATTVKSMKNKRQSFNLESIGMHKKSCRFILRKLSRYENYKDYLPFVKESSYNDSTRRLVMVMDNPILPRKMILNFKMDRIKKPGVYRFTFDHGFLKNLEGEIHVSKYKRRCLVVGIANWEGKDTGFSNIFFEFFTKTLAKIGLEKLFRISSSY